MFVENLFEFLRPVWYSDMEDTSKEDTGKDNSGKDNPREGEAMNKRTVAIIHALGRQDARVSISGLAQELSVSQRTIRNDLNTINELLHAHGLEELKLKSGGVVCRGRDFENILPLIAEKDFYTYKLSKEERIKIASSILVNSPEYITLSAIADALMVSRATVIHDLDSIKEFVRQGGLQVLSHPNKGLRVEGPESGKRLFLMRLADLTPARERNVVTEYISVQAGNKAVIQKILNEQERIYNSFLTDGSFNEILLYLGIMVNRCMQGEFMEARERTDSRKYRMAQDIVKYIVQYCHISSTEDEVQFLGELLASARYLRNQPVQQNVIKVQMITRQFIEKVSDELGINVNDDYDFFENLSNHLSSIMAQEVSYPENPVIDEILEENQPVLDAVKKKKAFLQNYFSRELTSRDLEYVAVHVCAALERKKNKEIAFHVIVACHAGIGTSQLLLEKLKTHFHFYIVDIVSSHEAKNLEPGKADLVITTVPLEGCRLDYVVVSPLLCDEDYIRVGNKIDALRNSRHLPSRIGENEVTAKGVIERIAPIIYGEVPEQADVLMKKLRKEIRGYFHQSAEADAEIFSPWLHHLLPPSHITLDVECGDWREAVRKSGERLLERGYIEERYIDAMIHNIEENGPYVVLSPGFAVPHEGLEAGSIKVGMNLIRLKTPVAFGSEDYDPVEFVCCLSAVDHKIHLKAFFHLVNMLQNPEFKARLQVCATPEEAAKVIEEYEYRL